MEPPREGLLHEYDALRIEVMQLYDEQSRLVFVSSFAAMAAIIGSQLAPADRLFLIPALLFVFAGVGLRSAANYHRIFRIGTYIAVVLEQRGLQDPLFLRCPNWPGWHSRWRKLAAGRRTLLGKEGSVVEALFLLTLSGGTVWWLADASTRAGLSVSNGWIVATTVAAVLLAGSLVALGSAGWRVRHYGVLFRDLMCSSVAPHCIAAVDRDWEQQ